MKFFVGEICEANDSVDWVEVSIIALGDGEPHPVDKAWRDHYRINFNGKIFSADECQLRKKKQPGDNYKNLEQNKHTTWDKVGWKPKVLENV